MATTVLVSKIDRFKLSGEFKRIWVNTGLIAAGSMIWAVGMNAVLIPGRLFSGGLVGIAMLINYRFTALDIGLTFFVLNIPFMILGWWTLGRRFIAYTVFGICFFSLIAAKVHPPVMIIEDHLLVALLAGVICGFGSGLILRSIGSAGGLDILAICLREKFGLQAGTTIFIFNAAVIIAGAYIHDLRLALYSIIFIFVCGKVINLVVSGFNTRKSVLIVSENSDRISRDILHEMGRGVTLLEGEGAFTHSKKKVILTVFSITDLPKLKNLILKHDRDAFVVINDTLEVIGNGFNSFKAY